MTASLKEILYTYQSENNTLNKWQAGLRPDYKTSDQTYILKAIIDKYLQFCKKRLHTSICFVDLKKAFDLVCHEGLFLRMLEWGLEEMYMVFFYNKYVTKLKYTNKDICRALQTK